MITLICGLTGSGKTWLLSRILYRAWKKNTKINVNFPVYFGDNQNVWRWWTLSDTYRLNNGIIAIDEAQKLLNAHTWASLPPMFADLICQHRHDYLDIFATTQDLGFIDITLRRNIHELYNCQTILRFPKNDRVKPIIHWIRVVHKKRRFDVATDRISFERVGRPKWFFISRFWTKKLYDTYAKTRLSRFVSRTIFKEKKWVTIIADRSLVRAGKVRGFNSQS